MHLAGLSGRLRDPRLLLLPLSMSSPFAELSRRHEALKKRIHAFRLPINSRAGRFAMGCIYFTTPLVVGYQIMRWSEGIRDGNLGGDGRREKLLEAKRARDEVGKPVAANVAAQRPRPVVEKAREL